jgi:Protein of unknown function (DUF998)
VQAAERSALIRRLAIASLAAQLAWVAIVAVAGLIEPGYSELRDPVSAIGAENAARPWAFNVAVTIWGASFVAAAAALVLDGPRGWRRWLGPALIALTGLAQILDGFPFPAECRTTIDPWCEARELAGEVSWRHAAHSVTYRLGAVALLLSVFAMAWRFRGDRRWGGAAPLALAGGLLGAAIVAGLFLVAGDGGGAGRYGLAQRLALAAAGLWVAALAIGLLAIHGRAGDRAFRFVAWLRESLPGGRLLVHPGSGLEGRSPEPADRYAASSSSSRS